jgi:hypothetical protein
MKLNVIRTQKVIDQIEEIRRNYGLSKIFEDYAFPKHEYNICLWIQGFFAKLGQSSLSIKTWADRHGEAQRNTYLKVD